MPCLTENYDVAVVGAGHAGCEAALASARLGLETIVFTVSVDSIALMPCNPNVGGSSKGHLVRELDALGGEMGKNIDKTFIQSKMLNQSKGPAVHSLRAQADKQEYTRQMRRTMENTDHLTIRQGRRSDQRTENVLRRDVLLQGGGAGNGNVPESEMYLWRCEQSDRTEWSAGGKPSDRFPEKAGNRDVPFQDGHTGACR